jgi:hypothetical protein
VVEDDELRVDERVAGGGVLVALAVGDRALDAGVVVGDRALDDRQRRVAGDTGTGAGSGDGGLMGGGSGRGGRRGRLGAESGAAGGRASRKLAGAGGWGAQGLQHGREDMCAGPACYSPSRALRALRSRLLALGLDLLDALELDALARGRGRAGGLVVVVLGEAAGAGAELEHGDLAAGALADPQRDDGGADAGADVHAALRGGWRRVP